MFSSLPDLQKERGFPHPSRKKKLLKLKRESTPPWWRGSGAGSHGQCFPDRGFFSCPISNWQAYVVNLNGAGRHRGLVQGQIIVARPPPILRPLDQPSTNRIHVHIFQALFKLPLMPYKPVPKLVLPNRSPAAAQSMKPQSRDLLHIMEHLPDQQRILRPDQSVPVIGHQNIPT